MKKRYAIEILIWILLIVFLLTIFGAIYHLFIQKKHSYLVHFNDVDGIIVGSPIKIMGIVVGHVEKLKYNDGQIAVEFLIVKKGVKIPPGSVAKVEFTGLAGSKSIEIVPPDKNTSSKAPILAQNPIRVKDIFEFGRGYYTVMNSVEYAITSVKKDDVYKVLDYVSSPNGEKIERASKKLDNFTIYMKGADNSLQKIVNTEIRMTNFVDTIRNYVKKIPRD